jgi:ELWxxDGT repeat protein
MRYRSAVVALLAGALAVASTADVSQAVFGGFSYPASLTRLGNYLYFAGDDGTSGTELWRTDGTLAGTTLVEDIAPGSDGSYPGPITRVGGRLFFQADEGGFPGLWVSDGTAAGTRFVVRVRGYTPTVLPAAHRLYFLQQVGTGGISSELSLWSSDGTSTGTLKIDAIGQCYKGCWPSLQSVAVGDQLYYAGNLLHPRTLFRTDGTVGGPIAVKHGLTVAGMTAFGNGVLLAANAHVHSRWPLLWRSDGTTLGTTVVENIGVRYDGSDRISFARLGARAYFVANDGVHGNELWVTDGTAQGTHQFMDINVGKPGSNPRFPIAAGNRLFFTADDGVHGRELWVTDGTPGGTHMVHDIHRGKGGSDPAQLTPSASGLFFVAHDGVNGSQIWFSNGTDVTRRLTKMDDGPTPDYLTSVGDKLFYVRYLGNHNQGFTGYLWVTDASGRGTHRVNHR